MYGIGKKGNAWGRDEINEAVREKKCKQGDTTKKCGRESEGKMGKKVQSKTQVKWFIRESKERADEEFHRNISV